MQIQQTSPGKLPKSLVTVVIVAAAVIVLLLAGWFAWGKIKGGTSGIKTSQFQAVFLTNGQVYFCKLSDIASNYVKCNNIFYLQVQQSVQPEEKNKKSEDQSQVSLAKLGSELHGPEDAMYISRDQVLFWENLKDDGKVAQAIKNYQTQNK